MNASEKQNQLIKDKHERKLSDIRFLLKNPEGRRVLWDLMSFCGVFRSSYSGEVNGTLVNEGLRLAGLEVLNLILIAKPSAFAQMQEEYASEINREKVELENNIKEGGTISL